VRITSTLISRLTRKFDKTPAAFAALTVATTGTALSLDVEDGVLNTATVIGGRLSGFSVQLASYTLAGLATYIAAQPGWSIVTPVQAIYQNLSALVLVDGSLSSTGGASITLSGFANPNWAFLDTAASQLQPASDDIALLPGEMSTTTADGQWLDFLGDLYGGNKRNVGEPDGLYSARIVAQAILLKCNNYAIALILQAYSGHPASVPDVREGTVLFPYDGKVNHDGSHKYAQPDSGYVYNLFDVTVTYDPAIAGPSQSAFMVAITALVNQSRATGNQMRNLVVLNTAGGTIGTYPHGTTTGVSS
jgi:hypothetical protein